MDAPRQVGPEGIDRHAVCELADIGHAVADLFADAKIVVKSLKNMVSRKGFEPLTCGLGNRCSILLSYRDTPSF